MLMRLDLYGFLFLLLLLSCKDNKPSVTEKIADEIPEEFYEFYNKFSSDSAYQMQHIIFPLDGKSAEDSLRNQAYLWQKDTWTIHQPFDDMGGTFSQSWYNVNSVIIEKINDNSGQFTMERRWAQLGGEWHLIYYKEMGR